MGKQSYKIEELVSKIERGEIKLPEMQRQFVWPATRIRDLLDSLYRGYPSGTILTWETSSESEVPTRDFPISQETSSAASFQLLLDGQQRLTSLSAILRGEPIYVKGRKRPIDILFNLEHPEALTLVTEVNEHIYDDDDPDEADASEKDVFQRIEQMAFVVKTSRLASLPHWVSVTEVFNNSDDAALLQKCGIENLSDSRYSKYTDRLKRLRDVKKYMYDVHVLERSMSYEEVAEIFVRVNSLGAKLRGSDLALAQITVKWSNSSKIFEEFQKECKEAGFYYDLGIYVKNLVAFTTGQSHFKTVYSLSEERLKEGWGNSKQGFIFALNFLKSNIGIDSPALLSTSFLIITLGYFAYQNDFTLTPEQESNLRYWLLVANAKGRYSRGSSETFLDQDLGVIRKSKSLSTMIGHLRTQFGRLEVVEPDLESRNSRSAYFKTMFLIFRNDGAKDWLAGLMISLKHSGVVHKLQFHHIFPQSILKGSYTKEKINDIANLSFICGRTNRKISNKSPAEYLPAIVKKHGEETLTQQCIPTDPALWTTDKYDDFLIKRRELIIDKLNKFMQHDKYR